MTGSSRSFLFSLPFFVTFVFSFSSCSVSCTVGWPSTTRVTRLLKNAGLIWRTFKFVYKRFHQNSIYQTFHLPYRTRLLLTTARLVPLYLFFSCRQTRENFNTTREEAESLMRKMLEVRKTVIASRSAFLPIYFNFIVSSLPIWFFISFLFVCVIHLWFTLSISRTLTHAAHPSTASYSVGTEISVALFLDT